LIVLLDRYRWQVVCFGPYRSKLAALNSIKGPVMKLSKGKANPALVGEILERKLRN
jgi:Asp-tRNA(Asn)/Glu-tRNA(Gln) amidotransferase B subunit